MRSSTKTEGIPLWRSHHGGMTGGLGPDRRGAAAVEFALCGLALISFIFGILNLGLLGLAISALQHATEETARRAAVEAAATPSACPTISDVETIFSGYTSPGLPASGVTLSYSTYASGSAQPLGATTYPWVTSGANGTPSGTYIALTASYNWQPVGLGSLFNGVPLTVKAIAFAIGAPACQTG